jgi:hypothetical protein
MCYSRCGNSLNVYTHWRLCMFIKMAGESAYVFMQNRIHHICVWTCCSVLGTWECQNTFRVQLSTVVSHRVWWLCLWDESRYMILSYWKCKEESHRHIVSHDTHNYGQWFVYVLNCKQMCHKNVWQMCAVIYCLAYLNTENITPS